MASVVCKIPNMLSVVNVEAGKPMWSALAINNSIM